MKLSNGLLSFVILVSLSFYNQVAAQLAPRIPLGKGGKPAMAIDYEEQKVHVVYVKDNNLMYRVGGLTGGFSAPETILSRPAVADSLSYWEKGKNSLWDPRILLDKNGKPHVVVADGHYYNQYVWYANKIEDTWTTPFEVFNGDAEHDVYIGLPCPIWLLIVLG